MQGCCFGVMYHDVCNLFFKGSAIVGACMRVPTYIWQNVNYFESGWWVCYRYGSSVDTVYLSVCLRTSIIK